MYDSFLTIFIFWFYGYISTLNNNLNKHLYYLIEKYKDIIHHNYNVIDEILKYFIYFT